MNTKDELLLSYLTWIESETIIDGYPEEERKRPCQIPPEFKHIHEYATATNLVGWCSAYNESVLWNAGWVITGEGNLKLAELRIEEQLAIESPSQIEAKLNIETDQSEEPIDWKRLAERTKRAGMQFNLIRLLTDRGDWVDFEELGQKIWDDSLTPPKTITQMVTRAQESLNTIGARCRLTVSQERARADIF